MHRRNSLFAGSEGLIGRAGSLFRDPGTREKYAD
jgi:hypothetical protein